MSEFSFLLIKLLFLINPVTIERTDITPGCVCTQFDADFDGFRYKEKIAHCKRRVTSRTLKFVRAAYQVNEKDDRLFEYDHLIPLSVGGSNNACNIWPEPLTDAHKKDVLEYRMYLLMKKGLITQKQAIAQFLAWPRKVQ
jgi:hypothetical protein